MIKIDDFRRGYGPLPSGTPDHTVKNLQKGLKSGNYPQYVIYPSAARDKRIGTNWF